MKEFIEILKRYKLELESGKKSSKQFLIEVGIIDVDGVLKENYKKLGGEF
jgi:hypothetical protein